MYRPDHCEPVRSRAQQVEHHAVALVRQDRGECATEQGTQLSLRKGLASSGRVRNASTCASRSVATCDTPATYAAGRCRVW